MGILRSRYGIIILGIIASLLVLVAVLVLQETGSSILNIESRWLYVAGIPILVALIVGGYIVKFKGFGLEIETRLKNPLGISNLKVMDAQEAKPGQEKEDLHVLEGMTVSGRAAKERLMMYTGRNNYVDWAVHEYLVALPNLQFIEIRDEKERFGCLIPIDIVKNAQDTKKLVDAISNNRVTSEFPQAETEYVKTTDNLLTILPKVRESKHGWLPVVKDRKIFIGIITKESIEEKIADEVLAAQQS
jgi:hypothetical protein